MVREEPVFFPRNARRGRAGLGGGVPSSTALMPRPCAEGPAQRLVVASFVGGERHMAVCPGASSMSAQVQWLARTYVGPGANTIILPLLLAVAGVDDASE